MINRREIGTEFMEFIYLLDISEKENHDAKRNRLTHHISLSLGEGEGRRGQSGRW